MRTRNYSIEEDKYIRTVFRDMADDEIAEALGRPEGSITRRRQRLGCWHVQVEAGPPLPSEKWRSLVIAGDFYQISNRGRIKAGNKLCTLYVNDSGYVQWRAVNKSKGLAVSIKVHREVARAFCHCPVGCDYSSEWHVHHKDHNPLNNSADNLEWLHDSEHRELHK